GFAFIVYIAFMFVSLFLLAIEGKASSMVILMISIIVVTLIFCTLVVVYVVGSKDRIVGFTRALAAFLNKLIHVIHRKNPEVIKLGTVERTFMELHEDFVLLKQNILEMRWAFLWITIACLAELGLLYAVFVAHGVWVNPGVVVVALVVASTAGLIAALPGGLGVFEPLMSAIFIAMGVPAGLALSVTLVFRIITLLLTLITGYPLYQKEIAKHGKAGL
ncbi:MAG TPA: flippase-like domain-containing protein, partial [Candidatus Saccharimonadales bacterium]|nr:flippase-like domain-containing protein [Candidatus Saccharimonadales bacterium]